MRAEAGNHFKFGERRIAGEIFVWIDFDIGWVIDGEQAHLVEIIEFFHGFEHAETDAAVARANACAIHFQIFGGIGNIALAGAGPVADDSGADHIGEKFVAAAVPDEDDGAGTAAAIDFRNIVNFCQRLAGFRPARLR